MGWWSTDIMGGDTPLDWEDYFYSICNVEKFPEGSNGIAPLKKKDIEDNLGAIMAKIEGVNEFYDKSIAYQVLTVLMMKAGAVIDDDMKKTFTEWIMKDEWAQEEEERMQAIRGLVDALAKYDSKRPVVIKSKGLFQVIAEHIADGKEGLVNR